MELLEREKITILDGFYNNIKLVQRYYQTFYPTQEKRVVLCGINPGRNGAGKTGIPFIDFKGASHLLSDIGKNDSEQSAQFILSIINKIESNIFYKNVYMTNISWFGFIKGGRNLNYYRLPSPLPTTFTESFIAEMDIVQPKIIVPLSIEVERTLNQMRKDKRLKYPLAPRLSHPYYCSIGNNKKEGKALYIKRITDLMNG